MRLRPRLAAPAAAAACALAALPVWAASGTTTPALKVLSRDILPASVLTHVVGAASATAHWHVGVSVQGRNAAGLARLQTAQYDKSSPLYRHFLTPAQYAASFGADRATATRVRSWLTAKGLHVAYANKALTYFVAEGTVAQVEKTFRVTLRKYKAGTTSFTANTTAPTVPTAVTAVAGLDTLSDRAATAAVAAVRLGDHLQQCEGTDNRLHAIPRPVVCHFLLSISCVVGTCHPRSVMWKSTLGRPLCEGPPGRCQQLRFCLFRSCIAHGFPARHGGSRADPPRVGTRQIVQSTVLSCKTVGIQRLSPTVWRAPDRRWECRSTCGGRSREGAVDHCGLSTAIARTLCRIRRPDRALPA